MKGLFGQHIEVTAKALDMRLQRQNLVMANIANVNTPQYKAKRLEFEEQMQKALDLDATGRMTKTNAKHMPAEFDASGFQGDQLQAFKPRMVHGEDAVDMDKEMTVMAKNAMMYGALTQVITKNFSGMKKAIDAGKA